MKLIATVDRNWAIGYQGGRLVRIPSDERFFRFATMHKTVIMGRVTLENFPAGQPPRDRKNVILTTKDNIVLNDVVFAHSVSEVLEAVKDDPADDVFVIGGASVFEQFLPYCDEAFLTVIDYSYDSDRYFPRIDRDDNWECVTVSEEQTYYDLVYECRRYVRKK